MCKFFSLVTEPEHHGGKRFYFDWDYRKKHLKEDDYSDSHSRICEHHHLYEDKCNKFEYNPLTRRLVVDQINSGIDDLVQVEDWLHGLDFKRIVEPLVIKPIVNPFKLPRVKQITDEHIQWLKDWSSIGPSVWASIWASVWDSVGAYTSSFFFHSIRARLFRLRQTMGNGTRTVF